MRKPLVLTALILFAGNIGTHSAQSKEESYKLRVFRTAYCLQGRMANGKYVHRGAVATDPRVIPMGTHMHIPGYGRGKAEDTGSMIKGHHIDVWVPKCSDAYKYTGLVTITIYR